MAFLGMKVANISLRFNVIKYSDVCKVFYSLVGIHCFVTIVCQQSIATFS